MAQFRNLKNAIAEVIKQNGNNEITGQLLQNALFSMINSLGGQYNFAGVVSPTFVPPVDSDERIFYLAFQPGTYVNFGENVVVNPGEIRYFAFSGTWGTGVVKSNIMDLPLKTAVLCTNNNAADAFTWNRTNNKDTVTLRGEWLLLLASDTSLTSTRVLYLCQTGGEKTFEITPGIGIWLNKTDLNTLSNRVVIPDEMYNSATWHRSKPTTDRILLYHQWSENSFGLIPDTLRQKVLFNKIKKDDANALTAYINPYNIIGAKQVNPPFKFYEDALVAFGDDFSGSLTWEDGYINRSGTVTISDDYKHSSMFAKTSDTLRISFASGVTFALYDENQTFLNTVGDSNNVYDWDYILPDNVKYVVANLQGRYFPGGSEYATHPAYLKWGVGQIELTDGYMDRKGVVKPATGYKHTPLIARKNNYLKINFASNQTIAFYDENQNIISMNGDGSNPSDWVLYVPDNVAYIVANINYQYGTQPPYLYWGSGNPLYEIEWLSQNGINRDNIRGKNWASLGDSITFKNKWQPILVELFGLNHTNCGIGSTTLAGQRPTAFWQDVRLNAVKAANPDIVTILGGANDIVYNVPIGTDDDFTNKNVDTFLGAYAYIIENLLTWKPLLRIVLLGTTWAHNDGKDLPSVTSGLTYTDYSNATKKVAQYYGLKFADLHGETGFNKFTQSAWFPDAIHPNDAGGAQIASIVVPEFDKIVF